MRRAIAISLALALVLASCGDIEINVSGGDRMPGSGTVATEDRAVSGFDQIALAGEGSVVVSAGPPALSIRTDDNLMEYIETSVDSGVLRISTRSGVDIDPTDSVVYQVSIPELVGLSLSGAGSFKVGSWESDAFSISLSGAGDIDVESLTATNIDVTISGVGEVTVTGTTASLDVTIPGAGSFEGAELRSGDAEVSTSGVGSATIWAVNSLDASVSGVGSIDYYGDPAVTESITGLGSIDAVGSK